MEYTKRFLFAFIFIAGLVTPHVFCALRHKMTGVINDASDITWAHAVNSRDALAKALAGPIDFLEADVTLGRLEGSEQSMTIPIMAHPPETTSDISLETWLNTVITTRPEKGVKLDFKSIDVLEPALIILQKHSSKLTSSVWLNADVLSGPISSTTVPVVAEKFITLCHQYFPDATLSTGWTTYWHPTNDIGIEIDPEHWHYGWQHVREMADMIRCRGYEGNHPNFTFPVRGIFASRSVRQFQWLLSVVPNSTLTVWSGKFDPLRLEDLLRIRESFPKNRVYYDVPEVINEIFQGKKNSVDTPVKDLVSDDGLWMTFTRGQAESCSAITYARNSIVIFGKSLNAAVLRRSVISLSEKEDLKVTGKIKFFDTTPVPYATASPVLKGQQELTLVLADVSFFAKDAPLNSQDNVDLTVSDTDVIWSAINSSAIYTIRHDYAQENTSCRVFKLDTLLDRSLEVWTVPCADEGGGTPEEDFPKDGIPEISSRKRLVLPSGPFMLGFISSGDEHVVIYDLKVETQRVGGGTFTSGSKSLVQASLGLLGVLSVLSLSSSIYYQL